MHMVFLLLTLSALNLGTSANTIEDFILNLHNSYRGKVRPPAANMQEMRWSTDLENKARRWISYCQFKHERKGPGENLAYDTNKANEKTLIRGAMKRFFDENKLYTYGSRQCGRACHYTQMVWATTTEVGCAMKRCPYLNVFGRNVEDAWYFACFYEPMGNMIGQKPYIAGAPCTKCGRTQNTCRRNLCTGVSCVDENKYCTIWQSMNECNKNPTYMSIHCRKACGKCEGKGTGTDDDNNTTDSGTEIEGSCEDSDRRCPAWARRGECSKNPIWMKKNCRKSCKQCGETSCSDSLDCCADMKLKGYCRKYKKFMRENCKKSCSRC